MLKSELLLLLLLSLLLLLLFLLFLLFFCFCVSCWCSCSCSSCCPSLLFFFVVLLVFLVLLVLIVLAVAVGGVVSVFHPMPPSLLRQLLPVQLNKGPRLQKASNYNKEMATTSAPHPSKQYSGNPLRIWWWLWTVVVFMTLVSFSLLRFCCSFFLCLPHQTNTTG